MLPVHHPNKTIRVLSASCWSMHTLSPVPSAFEDFQAVWGVPFCGYCGPCPKWFDDIWWKVHEQSLATTCSNVLMHHKFIILFDGQVYSTEKAGNKKHVPPIAPWFPEKSSFSLQNNINTRVLRSRNHVHSYIYIYIYIHNKIFVPSK